MHDFLLLFYIYFLMFYRANVPLSCLTWHRVLHTRMFLTGTEILCECARIYPSCWLVTRYVVLRCTF